MCRGVTGRPPARPRTSPFPCEAHQRHLPSCPRVCPHLSCFLDTPRSCSLLQAPPDSPGSPTRRPLLASSCDHSSGRPSSLAPCCCEGLRPDSEELHSRGCGRCRQDWAAPWPWASAEGLGGYCRDHMVERTTYPVSQETAPETGAHTPSKGTSPRTFHSVPLLNRPTTSHHSRNRLQRPAVPRAPGLAPRQLGHRSHLERSGGPTEASPAASPLGAPSTGTLPFVLPGSSQLSLFPWLSSELTPLRPPLKSTSSREQREDLVISVTGKAFPEQDLRAPWMPWRRTDSDPERGPRNGFPDVCEVMNWSLSLVAAEEECLLLSPS